MTLSRYEWQGQGRTALPWWVGLAGALVCVVITGLSLAMAGFLAAVPAVVMLAVIDNRHGDLGAALLVMGGLLALAVLTLFCVRLLNWLVSPHRWRARRLRQVQCPWCRYDIRNLPASRCPECGETWAGGHRSMDEPNVPSIGIPESERIV